MDLNKIGYGENPDKVKAIIEIACGSNIKYEVEKESGALVLDRVMHSAMYYPANYGFVNKTLSQDGDPADILILTEYPMVEGCVTNCRLVGVLIMEDESGIDEKLLAVPTSKIDPTFEEIQDLGDIPKHTLAKIKNFFETYKMLEPGKWVKVKGFEDKASATKILEDAIKNYKE
ncbi:MAG: inorganic diphosphatase [Sulfuricurvum sp.]|jgi:inorganic pyrophosphatase|uniref:inorganic diphosphatase n=1 Tax=Sulfuricurvum sp. TaxID=2025608 RepID=UPI00260E82E9|nr:inorganic diphosphatase [Sulfuricurvum sp.]MDD2829169.1 inorganic diphosphatase [Sulfuricurvum sp.]MDD4950218.1 inorganic diphosphatase [Sulfuricurvum sp.]